MAANVIVDPAAGRQTIRGFGGMNHTLWINDLTPAQRDTAFGNGEGQLGFTVLRIPVHWVNLYAISVQNEPDYARDWTWWTPGEMIRFLRENAGSIGTKVIAPESFQYVKGFSDPILNDSGALANLDILGAHLYGTPYQNFPYPLFKEKGRGKELWMTEVYYPNSSDSADLWPQALDVGEHIHRALVDAEFQAYVWWYIRRSYGPMREDGRISKRGAAIAHFSRFVRPGYVRIDVTPNPQSNLYVSAYTASASRNSGSDWPPHTARSCACNA
ncbi:hypothetical protein [Streptomyces rugosispiralis]|uniref:hypothetical protein n=1 Tax=Streptomyces rugosispiralis TaxID=2967341 RepID=UPI0027E449C8|nr:hypothetical protein [Streptomyces rugosispiralis]